MSKNCIFCGQDSTKSTSVEHIIPESLGNDKYILDRGIVCDSCNNYLAREVEKPILDLDDYKRVRFYQAIQSKKKRIPFSDALIVGDKVDFHWGKMNGKQVLMMGVSEETAMKIIKQKPEVFFTKGITLNDPGVSYEISRFIAKVGIEMYTYNIIEHYKKRAEYDDQTSLIVDDSMYEVIDFVRRGRKNKKPWFYTAEIIHEYSLFTDEIIAKMDFSIEKDHVYFIMTLFNTRFKLNMSSDSY